MRLTVSSLDKVGVTLVNFSNVTLQCDNCGQIWSPILRSEGRLPRGYWKCIHGCNEDALAASKKE